MNENKNGYQIMDTCKATVDGKDSRGIYLTLDDGESAFALSYLTLKRGDTVLCSVKRPKGNKRHAFVTIDSTMLTYAA